MRTTAGRTMACVMLVVLGLAVVTACQPLDANPNHVTIVDFRGTDHYTLQNRTGYSVRIDRQAFSQASLAFTPTTLLPGHDATAGPAYESVGGTMSATVSFTLLGARNPDGSPVTGTAEVTRTNPVLN